MSEPESSSGEGVLETIAYYENQGILMTVQAAEDEGQRQTKGEYYNLYFPIRTKNKTNGLHGVLQQLANSRVTSLVH